MYKMTCIQLPTFRWATRSPVQVPGWETESVLHAYVLPSALLSICLGFWSFIMLLRYCPVLKWWFCGSQLGAKNTCAHLINGEIHKWVIQVLIMLCKKLCWASCRRRHDSVSMPNKNGFLLQVAWGKQWELTVNTSVVCI